MVDSHFRGLTTTTFTSSVNTLIMSNDDLTGIILDVFTAVDVVADQSLPVLGGCESFQYVQSREMEMLSSSLTSTVSHRINQNICPRLQAVFSDCETIKTYSWTL